MDNLSTIYLVFRAMLLGLLLTLMLGWLGIWLANRLHLIDMPGSAPHKQHARPTPLAGGLVLVLVLLIGMWLLHLLEVWPLQITLLAALPIFVFGLWDDANNLRPLVKFFGQVMAATILVVGGQYVRFFESPEFLLNTNPTLALYLDWAVTLLWVVGITNAFNFVDSMDGLAAGLAGMSAAFFVLLTLDSGQALLSSYSALLLGLCLGLYFFNSSPALFFLGDSGAQTLGFILAVLAIAYQPQVAYQASSWFAPILLLGVPIFDTTLVFFSRLRHKQAFYRAGLNHTYHRLLRLTASSNRAVLVMQMAAFALGCVAFLVIHQPPLQANLTFATLLGLGLLLIVGLEYMERTG